MEAKKTMTLFKEQYEAEGLELRKEKGKFRCILCENDVEELFELPFKINFETLQKIMIKDPSVQIVNITHSTEINPEIDLTTGKLIKGKCYEINIPHCRSCMDKMRNTYMYKRKRMLSTKQL